MCLKLTGTIKGCHGNWAVVAKRKAMLAYTQTQKDSDGRFNHPFDNCE